MTCTRPSSSPSISVPPLTHPPPYPLPSGGSTTVPASQKHPQAQAGPPLRPRYTKCEEHKRAEAPTLTPSVLHLRRLPLRFNPHRPKRTRNPLIRPAAAADCGRLLAHAAAARARGYGGATRCTYGAGDPYAANHTVDSAHCEMRYPPGRAPDHRHPLHNRARTRTPRLRPPRVAVHGLWSHGMVERHVARASSPAEVMLRALHRSALRTAPCVTDC